MHKEIIKQIRSFIQSPDYRPLNKSEFARELAIAPKERSQLREALGVLVDKGELELGKKSRYIKPGAAKKDDTQITGVILFSRDEKKKAASFIPDEPKNLPFSRESSVQESVFVPARATSTALHGDKVAVRIVKKAPPRWHKHVKSKRERSDSKEESIEAHVISIVERQNTTFVGEYQPKGHTGVVLIEDGRLPPQFEVKKALPEVRPGDLVAIELVSWSDRARPPLARMIEVLGKPGAPGVDMLKVIFRYNLPLHFPPEALAEAAHVDEVIPEKEIARREDWREREVFTIDPEDARDFDDAISVRDLPGGKGWELAVHIADVSYYVKPGSAIDREARKRGNSVYLADRVIPMIPEKLSNGVCSLNPHVDRLTHAAIMEFDVQGNMKKARFVSAVIRSCRRYTYEDAYNRLMLSDEAARQFEEPERSIVAHMRKAWKLAAILRKKRFSEGCFDLDFPEVRAVLNDQGVAFAVKKSINDESHQLIEEFMLAANEAVAKETRRAPVTSIYRIHEDPDFEKLNLFAEMVRFHGFKMGDPTIRSEVQKLTVAIRGRPEEHSLKMALLKSLKRAAYSHQPTGHFGLAKKDYCHFTSPIRRYADLIAHRALKRLMASRKEPTSPEHPDKTPNEAAAADISVHISRTERIAADAERDSQQLKLIEYLEGLIAEDSDRTFQAVVTEVRPIGIFVELADILVRGQIRKVDLPSQEGLFFDKSKNRFVSAIRKKQSYGLGDILEVRLLRMDKSRGFVDFALVL